MHHFGGPQAMPCRCEPVMLRHLPSSTVRRIMVQVTGLNIYPVKSCRGIALTQARLTETGFEHDREWLVITPEGRFLTQRERPQLAQVETAIAGERLILRKPSGADLSLPLDMTGPEREVTIWRD